MPELSRFYGIIIRMYWEVGAPSHATLPRLLPGEYGVFSIDPIDMMEGSMPTRQRRLVEAWVELHQDDLQEDWREPVPA